MKYLNIVPIGTDIKHIKALLRYSGEAQALVYANTYKFNISVFASTRLNSSLKFVVDVSLVSR